MEAYQSLDDLLNDCTVRIQTSGGHGTGFFVAPGLILTCAHVIDDAFKSNAPITIYCNYNQQTVPARQISKDDVFPEPYPDLAFLRVDNSDHPCVLLGGEIRSFTDLYSYGYTKDFPGGESTTVECEGTFEDNGTLIKLKKGQVKPGSSGSPLLNKRTGSVCGVIARTRDKTSDLGGAGIPMETAFAILPDLERQNFAFHRRNPLWKNLIDKETTAKSSKAVAALRYDKPGKISKPKHWVGRMDLLSRIDPLLDQFHKVLLTGMGGIGKTSLAQMLVDKRLQAGSRPVFWLEVGDEKVDILIEALAEKCGDEKILSMPGTEAKKLALKELLENYETDLLVIDDIRNLNALDDLLDAIPDKLPVIMTSRISFEADDIVDVSQLQPEQALELLAKTSGAGSYTSSESARALCQFFGYHPLALEIAGASMKERKNLDPAVLLKRLKSNPMKLSSLRRGEIRPLLDDCVSGLADILHSVFFAFGKFAGNRATPTFLATFLKTSIEDVTDALEELALRNLVKSTPEAEVYYLHDLVFHYVQTVSGLHEQDKSHLIQTGISYLEAHRYDYDLIGFDLFNLLEIARNADGIDLVKLMSYLTIGNYPIQEGRSYADQRGYPIRLIEQLERAVESARNLGGEFKPTTHYLLGKRGNAAFWRGEYDLAAEKYKEEVFLSPNDKRRAFIGSILARTLAFAGHVNESREQFEAARALAEKLQDDELRGDVLGQESWAAGYLKDYENALRVAEQQVVLAEALYHRNGSKEYDTLAFALLNFGSAKVDLAKQCQGGVDGVLDTHTRAKILAEQNEDDRLLAQAHRSLGEYYHYIGDRAFAEANFNKSIQIWHAIDILQEEQDLKNLMQELGYSVLNPKDDPNEHKT